MKSFKLIRGLLLILILLASTEFYGAGHPSGGKKGGDSSGGTDLVDQSDGSAWFLGTQAINYCVVTSNDFGISNDAAKASLTKALQIWKKYILTNRLGYAVGTSPIPGEKPSVEFLVPKTLALKYVEQACDGKEDLKFYFGGTNPEIETAKLKRVNPTGFVSRSSYDLNNTWSKGFLWIAPGFSVEPENRFPDWNKNNNLIGQLLHELGHTYGNPHVPGTIMDPESLIQSIRGAPESQPANMKKYWDSAIAKSNLSIDGAYMLYLCHECNTRYFSNPIFVRNLPNDLAKIYGYKQSKVSADEMFYKHLIGHPPKGNVSQKFEISQRGTKLYYTIADDYQESFRFVVEAQKWSDPEFGQHNLASQIFKRTFLTGKGEEMNLVSTSASDDFFGTIKSPTGVTQIRIRRNTRLSKLALSYQEDNAEQVFFRTDEQQIFGDLQLEPGASKTLARLVDDGDPALQSAPNLTIDCAAQLPHHLTIDEQSTSLALTPGSAINFKIDFLRAEDTFKIYDVLDVSCGKKDKAPTPQHSSTTQKLGINGSSSILIANDHSTKVECINSDHGGEISCGMNGFQVTHESGTYIDVQPGSLLLFGTCGPNEKPESHHTCSSTFYSPKITHSQN